MNINVNTFFILTEGANISDDMFEQFIQLRSVGGIQIVWLSTHSRSVPIAKPSMLFFNIFETKIYWMLSIPMPVVDVPKDLQQKWQLETTFPNSHSTSLNEPRRFFGEILCVSLHVIVLYYLHLFSFAPAVVLTPIASTLYHPVSQIRFYVTVH